MSRIKYFFRFVKGNLIFFPIFFYFLFTKCRFILIIYSGGRKGSFMTFWNRLEAALRERNLNIADLSREINIASPSIIEDKSDKLSTFQSEVNSLNLNLGLFIISPPVLKFNKKILT